MAFTGQHLHDAEQCFWAHHPALREQLRRPPHRRQLGLELGYPSSRGPKLGGFGGRRAPEFAPVDTVLANPPIDRRFHDGDGPGVDFGARHERPSAGNMRATDGIARSLAEWDWPMASCTTPSEPRTP